MKINHKRQLVIAFAVGLIALVSAGALVLKNFSGIDSPLIIHFDVYSGLNLLGSAQQVFNIVLIGFVIYFLNTALAFSLLKRHEFFSYIVAAVSALVGILVLIAVSVLINVNL